MSKPAARPATVVIIGAGPRGAGLLERLCANAPEFFEGRPLEVHLVDPHPFGSGRIWRRDQSPLLWANSMAEDTTMFTDESCTIKGPLNPGPNLAEWADAMAQSQPHDGRPGPASDGVEAELRSLTGTSFPSRRLINDYLSWMFWRTVLAAPPEVTVQVHAQQALDLTSLPDGRELVTLDGGREPLVADAVLLALGHLPSRPLGASAVMVDFAARHDLPYLAENYAADADLSQFRPGDDVLVRGFGLAFIDLMVLLTEGRGGVHQEDADGLLTYRPSGREPRLHVGSRRGVPYRSKLTYGLQASRPPHPRFFDDAAVERLLARPGPIDVQDDVWPLIVREILFGYYHELFLGHPDRVRSSWAEFETVLAETDLARLTNTGPTSPIGSTSPTNPSDRARTNERAGTTDPVAAAVPDPADRFDLDAFDRPLHGRSFTDARAFQTSLRRHVEADLDRRSDAGFSADLGAFGALLAVLVPLSRLMSSGRMSVPSQLTALPRFFSFFSYFASGPPPRRLRELLALSEAGVVSFLGPDTVVEADDSAAAFVASSPAVPGEVRARGLIEARVPRPTLAGSGEPLVRNLFERGELGELELAEAGGPRIGTGRVLVDPDCRIIDRAGRAHPRRYAFGAWTSAATAAAFSRPRTNSPFFQQNDAAARDVLAQLSDVRAGAR